MDLFTLKQFICLFALGVIALTMIIHVFYILAILQRNEYRIDRLYDFLKSYQGLKVSVEYSLFFLIIFILLLTPFNVSVSFIIFLSFLYAVLLLDDCKRLYKRTIQRPIWTKKIQFIAFLSITIPLSLFVSNLFLEENLYLATILKHGLYSIALSLILAKLLTLFFVPFTWYYKKRKIKKAKEKMKTFPNLLVIGITGSYGKTSVKEYLYQTLKTKYTVLKTRQHVNTEIGVANTVLNDLKDEHEIFIVEMGAYKKGEIKAICDIVKPKIGIITAIIEQHLALFGSIENIYKAKKELVDSLPNDGLAILNKSNPYCAKIYHDISIPKKSYSIHETTSDLYSSDILMSPNQVSFHVDSKLFHVKLHGKHHVENLLPCILVSRYLGLTDEEIQDGFNHISPLEKTLTSHPGINECVILDDTYNLNVEGLKAAINYMHEIPGNKRHIIMPSLKELGEKGSQIHEQVSAFITRHCDYFYYISHDYQDDILKGAKEYKDKVIFATTNKLLLSEIKKRLTQKDIVLFESRGAESVMDALKLKR